MKYDDKLEERWNALADKLNEAESGQAIHIQKLKDKIAGYENSIKMGERHSDSVAGADKMRDEYTVKIKDAEAQIAALKAK